MKNTKRTKLGLKGLSLNNHFMSNSSNESVQKKLKMKNIELRHLLEMETHWKSTIGCLIEEIKELSIQIKDECKDVFETIRTLATHESRLISDIAQDFLIRHRDVIDREMLIGVIPESQLPELPEDKMPVSLTPPPVIPKPQITKPTVKLTLPDPSKISNYIPKSTDLKSLVDEMREQSKWGNFNDIIPILDKMENLPLTLKIIKTSNIIKTIKAFREETLLPQSVLDKIDELIHSWKTRFRDEIIERKKEKQRILEKFPQATGVVLNTYSNVVKRASDVLENKEVKKPKLN